MRESRQRRTCSNCDGFGWVCEIHPRRPWYGPDACDCGGAGMQCPVCNPSVSPDDLQTSAPAGIVSPPASSIATVAS